MKVCFEKTPPLSFTVLCKYHLLSSRTESAYCLQINAQCLLPVCRGINIYEIKKASVCTLICIF